MTLGKGSTFEVVVVGASQDGQHALETLLRGLPERFPVPVVVVMHGSREGHPSELLARLQAKTGLLIHDVEDKDELLAGHVYLAPPDYHLLIEQGWLSLSVDHPVNGMRPSIDVLFESAADTYGSRATGIVLSGLGSDGARGAAAIKRRGGVVLVEDPASAESAALPAAAVAATSVDRVLPLGSLPSALIERVL